MNEPSGGNQPLDERVRDLVSRDLAYALDVVPLRLDGRMLVVGVSDLKNQGTLTRIGDQTNLDVKAEYLPINEIRDRLARMYPAHTTLSVASEVQRELDSAIKFALDAHASDIHIEAYGSSAARIRVRIDGVLVTRTQLQRDVFERLVVYVKTAADINISESVLPQDGKISRTVDGRKVDMRVNIINGTSGAKIALRIHWKFEHIPPLESWGLPTPVVERLRAGAARASSFLLIAGPTGSGKTTLLHALLAGMPLDTLNVYSVEDPVEMTAPQIAQVETRDAMNLSFSASVSAFLRQDPDLIVVGELRDTETTRECLKAATSGLRLMGTTHARSATEIVDRLVELSQSEHARFRIADTLTLAISMRLLRVLCPECKQPAELSEEGLRILRRHCEDLVASRTVFAAKGCPKCFHLGYRKRFAVIEVLELTERIREAIRSGKSRRELVQLAVAEGAYEPMFVEALRRVAQGHTSEAELLNKLAYETITVEPSRRIEG